MTDKKDERSVQERVADVSAALKAIGKNSKNMAQRFNYRSIDDMLNEIHPLLGEHKVFIYPSEVRNRIVEARPTAKGNVQFSARHEQQYTVAGALGDSFTIWVPCEATDFGDKATTKAMTFAFKTALAQMLSIPTDDIDPDDESPDETKQRDWPSMYQNTLAQGHQKFLEFLAWAKTQPDAPQQMIAHGEKELEKMGTNNES